MKTILEALVEDLRTLIARIRRKVRPGKPPTFTDNERTVHTPLGRRIQ